MRTVTVQLRADNVIGTTEQRLFANGFGKLRLREARQFHHVDLNAMNTRDNPDRVAPVPLGDVRIEAERIDVTLTPTSWTMLRLR
jgi:alpha-N-arabinofuranosidase